MRSAVGATPETDAAPYTGTGEPPATEQMPAPDPRRAGSAACLLRPAAARLTGGCDATPVGKVQNVRRDSTARRCGELWLPMTTDHSKTRRMTTQSPSPVSEDSEEERAFLQARVALFWKVIFFIILLSSGLGAIGAVAKPGVDLLFTLASTANAGIFWWLCRRGERSARFSRRMESGGLLLNSTISALLGRYLLAGFARDHSLGTAEATVMADGYLSMLQLCGMSMMVAIRAALIPSSPRRTVIVTALFGFPMILVTTVMVPIAGGGLAWRALDSGAYPWLPASLVMIWGFAVITCAVISWVIYGLRAEVREARRLGQYVLERKIGEGGMGEVYRARHGMMRRPSAIKLLRADRAGKVNLGRFEREVQLTARLTHPNTITIFDYGRTHDGVFYYAMELLDGATLLRIVAVDGPQPAGRVVRILAMACGALAEAHAIGLIHRDIKPANIMLCMQGGERDVVKLLDFGLVKEFEVGRQVELTGASTLVGTPQVHGSGVHPRPRLGRCQERYLCPWGGRLLSARRRGRLRREVDRRGVQPAPPPEGGAAVRQRARDPGRPRGGGARVPQQGSRRPTAERR